MTDATAYALDDLLARDGVWNRARHLLEKGGIPLEIQVQSLCKRFADSTRERLDRRGFPSSDRLIYGDLNQDAPLREVDQLVSFYDEIQLADEMYGISLGTSVAIECKRREGVSFFGIRRNVDDGRTDKLSTIPLSTALAGSQVVTNALSPDPGFLKSARHTDIVGMRIDKKGGPRDLDKEQLVYKASAASYDYLKRSWDDVPDYYADVLSKSGILEDAGIDYKGTFYLDWRWWLEKLQPAAYKRFNDAIFEGEGCLHFGAKHGMAVVCTDSPLYEVAMSDAGTLEEPRPVKWLRTSGRYQVGIGTLRRVLAKPTPELDSFLVHYKHLVDFLEGVLAWESEQIKRLAALPNDMIERAPLEAALRRLVHPSNLKAEHTYTSEIVDFD